MKDDFDLGSLSYTNMKEYPTLESVPEDLRYVFTKDDSRALKTLIVSSYKTHKKRTREKMTKRVPSVPYNPPRRFQSGRMIWKKKPRDVHYWVTNQSNLYSLLIADEAQKIKNYRTGIFTVLFEQRFQKFLGLTATPIYNSVKVSLSPFLPHSKVLLVQPHTFPSSKPGCTRRTLC